MPALQHPTERRECAGPDCEQSFLLTVANRLYCSSACQCRAARLRRNGASRRYAPYAAVLRTDDELLLVLRERAVHELALGVVAGAEGAVLAKVANLVLAADRRLQA